MRSSGPGPFPHRRPCHGGTPSLLQSIREGRPSHELVTGRGFWEHLAGDAAKGAVFDEAMTSFKDLGGASVVVGHDWWAGGPLRAAVPGWRRVGWEFGCGGCYSSRGGRKVGV
jgi:hypothetical protein